MPNRHTRLPGKDAFCIPVPDHWKSDARPNPIETFVRASGSGISLKLCGYSWEGNNWPTFTWEQGEWRPAKHILSQQSFARGWLRIDFREGDDRAGIGRYP